MDSQAGPHADRSRFQASMQVLASIGEDAPVEDSALLSGFLMQLLEARSKAATACGILQLDTAQDAKALSESAGIAKELALPCPGLTDH